MPQAMLSIKNATYSYNGKIAVDNISMSVESGDFIAIAGRNGSGKTTLTRLIMTLLKPSSGTIALKQVDTSSLSPSDMAKSVGYVFQNPDSQIFRDTVAKEVSYGPEQLGFDKREIDRAVEWALTITGLTEVAERFPRTLSRGQKQKVAIASALAMRPKILILDEPTSGQDPWDAQSLMELLTELNKQGITIILVTHDMEIISKYSSRVVVLDKGKKVYDGTPAELFNGSLEIAAWGLIQPTAVALARRLKGIRAATSEELLNKVTAIIRNGGEPIA